MFKKLTLLAMSVAALLALAAPAAQAANPLIVDGVGNPITKLTALSGNTKTVTGAGTLECTTVHLKGNITTNTNNTASGSGTGTATGTPAGVGHAVQHTGHCASSSGLLVEVTSVTLSNIHLEAKGGGVTSGTASFQFTYDLRSGATPGSLVAACTLGTTATHKVVVTKTGTSTIKIHGFIDKIPGSHTSAFCPGTGSISGDFTLTNEVTGLPAHIK